MHFSRKRSIMAKYCSWYTEEPKYERCYNFAEPGKSRCEDHRLKKRARKGNLTFEQKEHVRRTFGGICAVPGCQGEAHEVDHIVELDQFPEGEKWKANLSENLQILCFYHHSLKTAEYRKSKIDVGDPNDRSTSARNRKKKRMRAQGFYR